MLKNQKGITLVALVVTIVILIILATISIAVVFQGGLIDRANQAADFQANADQELNELSDSMLNFLDDKIPD